MKINKIVKLKNSRYKIVIDGESIVTFDNVILENNLLYKKDIDDELYSLIMKDTIYYEVYNKVVKYILKKRRSEKEIKNYLLKFNLSNQDTEKMIFKLKENNLINDTEYCKAFINDSIYLSNKGINKIRKELLNQEINAEIIEKEISNIDNQILNNKLEKIINKKINMNKKYSNNYLKQKLLNELLELGYNKNDILNIIEENLTTTNYEILNKEFDKVYTKLQKKYDGYELIKNVKIKMLSRGFNVSEIEQLLKEKAEK